VGQIQALAGCDRLTISPELLKELEASGDELPRRLAEDGTRTERPPAMDEARFRWGMNEDAMATDKLSEGIRKFAADQRQLEKLLAERL
jgi:transaldolase